MSQPVELAAGVIHDIGYRHYDGPRLGRWQSVRAVYVHSLRGLFGLGRPARSKVVPFLLLAITGAPALVSGALTAVAPIQPIAYTKYAYFLQIAIMVFLAAQAPQIVTGDIRFRTLSLYFSRPLERADYVWAKLAALASGMFILLAVPLLVIYLAVLVSHTHSLSDAAHETGRLLDGLTGAAVYAVVLAALGMAISAFTRVRAFAIVGIIGVYLVTTSVTGIVAQVTRGTQTAVLAELASPFPLLDGFQSWALRVEPTLTPGPGDLGWAFGLATAAVLAAAIAIVHLRYRSLAQ